MAIVSQNKVHIIVIVLITLGVGAGVFLPSLIDIEPAPLVLSEKIKGVIIESPPRVLPDFNLISQNGAPFTDKELEGKWSLVFFGYTNCPDVCPTTLGTLDRVSRQQDMPTDTQYLFVSVDPKRDTVEKLNEFIGFFKNDKFTALRGEKAEIDKLTEQIGVTFDYEESGADGNYIVNHYAAIFLIDPKARVRAYILPPHDVARVTEVYRTVRNYYSG